MVVSVASTGVSGVGTSLDPGWRGYTFIAEAVSFIALAWSASHF